MKCNTRTFYWLFLLLLVIPALPATAQKKKKGNTEQQLIFRIISCLANEDANCYLDLFPDIDTLSLLAMKHSDPTSRDYKEMAALQNQPELKLRADSIYKSRVKQGFDNIIAQGKDEGIHWPAIVQVRYELVKALPRRDAIYEKMAPTRFTGYLFVLDPLTRKTFGFTVSEMLQMNETWYGGYLGAIYEAASKDEYEDAKLAAKHEKKPVTEETKDTTINGKEEEITVNERQKDIGERKLYTGMFDNEIPVQLYVRGLKGTCKEGICTWEAIYKFGDQDDYILLTVTKTEEGKWSFIESPPAGSMELTLKNGKYTGNWTSSDNNTGYEVKLTEAPASGKKIERLDAAFMDLRNGGGKD